MRRPKSKSIIEDTPNFRWRLEYARQKNCITEARSLRSAATLLLEFRLRFEFECLRVGFLRSAHEKTKSDLNQRPGDCKASLASMEGVKRGLLSNLLAAAIVFLLVSSRGRPST